MTLALLGGTPANPNPIAKYNSIGWDEASAAQGAVLHKPLSGFLGGIPRGGELICELEEKWAKKVGAKYAVACNSATSGLLAACMAAGIEAGDEVVTTPYTMSATASAPRFLDARMVFYDIDPDYFCLDPAQLERERWASAVIATNLFGHPADLFALRASCDKMGATLIEDAAQSPFAQENGKHAGTIGHIGVYSLNVHKHIQCGEGGICVTDDSYLADRLRNAINHGEMLGDRVGLNLRMTEYTAAIALQQLYRADDLIEGRIRQANALTNTTRQFDWITPPKVRSGSRHVYYIWAFKLKLKELGIPREIFIRAMEAEGFPLVGGYVKPLYHIKALRGPKHFADCPVAEKMYNRELGYFENCGWTLNDTQIEQFRNALAKIDANLSALRSAA
jgi:dTDP-4-amino-4,6-dideoxygalactose transaminase